MADSRDFEDEGPNFVREEDTSNFWWDKEQEDGKANIAGVTGEAFKTEPTEAEKIAANWEEQRDYLSTEEAMLITQMRIYDVLLGIYSQENPGKATALMNLHESGKFLGPEPYVE